MDNEAKEFRKALHTYVLRVDMTKENGENRIMFCTLNPNFVKENFEAFEHRSENPRKPKPDRVFSVWDLQKNAWRTVKLDNVNAWEFNHDPTALLSEVAE